MKMKVLFIRNYSNKKKGIRYYKTLYLTGAPPQLYMLTILQKIEV